MCGILGISFQNGCTMTDPTLARVMLRELFVETEIRGYDATGVAFINRDSIKVLKAPMAASDFIKTEQYIGANRKYFTLNGESSTVSVIGHCRAKTKGSPLDNNNNHPIVTRNVVGVHNGVIANDDALFNRFKGYTQNFSRRAEVDSEIIFRIIDFFAYQQNGTTKEAIRKMSTFTKGSYVCAMVERRNPFLLWLFRQSGPVTLYHYRKCGVLVFASLEAAIQNAMQGYGLEEMLGEPDIVNVPRYGGVCLNLFANKMMHLKIEGETYTGYHGNM